MKNTIGIIGLAPMGQNLAQNIASRDIKLSVFNRSRSKTDDLISKNLPNIDGFFDLEEFISSLELPRKIILLVKANEPTDLTIEAIKPLLDKGDIIIDMGNSFWKDTERRQTYLETFGINFVGSGVSGGWKGALEGPSIMPSGEKDSVTQLIPVFQKIAAKDFAGQPAVTNVGTGASGHFVKMVHNGIEYAIMQALAEFYDILRHLGLSNSQMAKLFESINQGKNQSYLLDITIEVLKYKLPEDSFELLNYIQPVALAKGTGLWTVESALEFNMPCSLLFAGLDGRIMSQYKNLYTNLVANKNFSAEIETNFESLCDIFAKSFKAVTCMSFVQGIELIKSVSESKNWNVDLKETLRIWQGGCIIRTKILEGLSEDFDSYTSPESLSEFCTQLKDMYELMNSNELNISIPVLDATKNYLNMLKAETLPQNLIQAQRDYFGSHTFRRIDEEGDFTDTWGQL